MGGNYQVLTEEDATQFVERGFVRVEGCFARDVAEKVVEEMWARLGYDPLGPSTWVDKRIHIPSLNRFEVSDSAPKAWAAACDLVGGKSG